MANWGFRARIQSNGRVYYHSVGPQSLPAEFSSTTLESNAMGLFDGTMLERPIICGSCGEDVKICRCPPVDTPPEKQTLTYRLERRKRGKVVTVLSGFACSDTQLRETLSYLQSKCGSGGAVAEASIELQGDHLARIPPLLTARGYRIK